MFAVTFLLLAPAQAGALAADFKAQSSTRFHWYNDPFQDRPRGDLLKYGFASGGPGPAPTAGGTRLDSYTSHLTNRRRSSERQRGVQREARIYQMAALERGSIPVEKRSEEE